jgi:hypothetical protein
MASERFTARIEPSIILATDVSYATLLDTIVLFTLDAAVARSSDDARWEQETLRKKGLSALELSRNGRAIWNDAQIFESELKAECDAAEFLAGNQLDPEVFRRLDRDLRRLWRRAGYEAPSLAHDMKTLFIELEADIRESAAGARSAFVDEIVRATSESGGESLSLLPNA